MEALSAAASIDERKNVLSTLLAVYEQRVYDPAYRDALRPLIESDWDELLDALRFEEVIQERLNKIGIHPIGFEHDTNRKTELRRRLAATFFAGPKPSPAWIFQDVHSHGLAAREGIKPGDSLLKIDGHPVLPPQIPMIPYNMASRISCSTREGTRTIDIAPPPSPPAGLKYWLFHREPHRYAHSTILNNGIGYVRIAEFPGLVGVETAQQIDDAFRRVLHCDKLIVDLRGNPGGGTANLRLMTNLTPEELPVGYSLTRRRAESGYRREELPQFRRIPRSRFLLPFVVWKYRKLDKSIVVVTEGRRKRRYDGRIALLVNRHTTSGAEIVAGFAKDHALATLVGESTRGRLLGFSRFPLGHGYYLTLPVSNYVTWEGKIFEHEGIRPDIEIAFQPDEVRAGRDTQLEKAIEMLA
jgi:C-terminal processing protease CtpA/Prc